MYCPFWLFTVRKLTDEGAENVLPVFAADDSDRSGEEVTIFDPEFSSMEGLTMTVSDADTISILPVHTS